MEETLDEEVLYVQAGLSPAGEGLETPDDDRQPNGLEDIDELMRNHRECVLGYALSRVRDRDIAETVTQECLLKAFNSRALYRGQCSVRTWLMAIVKNLIHDRQRTRRFQFWKAVTERSIDVDEMKNRLVERRPTPEANLLTRETLRRVWIVVDSLPKSQRAVMSLRFVEEMELLEISQATGLKLSTVKSYLHRALRRIRTEMDPQTRLSSKERNTSQIRLSSRKRNAFQH